MSVLSIAGLKKTYPNGNEAIRDISFEVGRGEFVFLSGPSGSGKTTLIRILLKMEESTGGQVLVFGKNLNALLPSAVLYLRRNIGVIFQDFQVVGIGPYSKTWHLTEYTGADDTRNFKAGRGHTV